DSAIARRCLFAEAFLDGARFHRAQFTQSIFLKARLVQTDFAAAKLDQCIFSEAEASGARFIGADLTYADFSGARIPDANFTGATLFRTKLHRVQDEGAIFDSRALALGDDPELLEAETWRPNI